MPISHPPVDATSPSLTEQLLSNKLLNRIAGGDKTLIQEVLDRHPGPVEKMRVNDLVVDLMTLVAERRDAREVDSPTPVEVALPATVTEHRGSRR